MDLHFLNVLDVRNLDYEFNNRRVEAIAQNQASDYRYMLESFYQLMEIADCR